MKKKLLIFSSLALGILGLAGVNLVSAQGWLGRQDNASSQEMVERQEIRTEQKAALLGISADELKAKLTASQTPCEIAEEAGIDKEALREKMQGARQERLYSRLQSLIENGKITQEQADERLRIMREQLANDSFGHRTGKSFKQGFDKGLKKGLRYSSQ